jgi:hypothetical protein
MRAIAKPLCIYSQDRPGATRDHVFPFAWYPTTTASRIQRRTVPCCPECNQRLHSAEDAIGFDLLFCCNPTLPQIARVQESIRRAWNADQAEPKNDRKHRLGRLLRIQRTIAWAPPYAGAPIAVVEKNGSIEPRPQRGSWTTTRCKQWSRSSFEGFIISRCGRRFPSRGHNPRGQSAVALDLLFKAVPLPNRYIRMPDPRMTVGDIAAELIRAISRTPRITMCGPGFQYQRLRTPEGCSMWVFQLGGN